MWCDVMWCDVMWCDVMWRDVTWRDVTWRDVTWRDVTWRDVTWCFSDDRLSADLWLLNSCTVKGPAEDHFRNDVAEGRKLGKPVVVAGCVPQGQPKAKYIEVKGWDTLVFNSTVFSPLGWRTNALMVSLSISHTLLAPTSVFIIWHRCVLGNSCYVQQFCISLAHSERSETGKKVTFSL